MRCRAKSYVPPLPGCVVYGTGVLGGVNLRVAPKLVQRVGSNVLTIRQRRVAPGADGAKISCVSSGSRLGGGLRRADTASVVVSHGGGGAEASRDLVVLGPRMGTRRAGDGQLPVGPRVGRVRRHVIHCCAAPFVLCKRWRSVPRLGSGAAPVGERATDVWPHGRIIPGRHRQADPARSGRPYGGVPPAEPPTPRRRRQFGGQVPRAEPAGPVNTPRVPRGGRRRLRQQHGDCSAAVAFEVLVRVRGPDDMSALPSPVHSGPAWVVDDDVGSTANTRNAVDVVNRTTMTVVRAGSDTQV